MRRAVALLGLALALWTADASAATLDVPGRGPLALAGDQVLHTAPSGRIVTTALPSGVSTPTTAFSAASSTWIGTAENVTRVCCKAADSLPVSAKVQVRRADGSDPRTLLSCAPGDGATVLIAGATLLFSGSCPATRVAPSSYQVVDPQTGAIRTLALPPTTETRAFVPPALSATQLAVAYYRANGPGTSVHVIDVSTGATVRAVDAAADLSSIALLDDGTLVLAPFVSGCAVTLTVIAPDGTRTSTGPACTAPVAAGGRFAYTRSGAQGGDEIVVQTPGSEPEVVGRRWSAGTTYGLALDDRRVAWPAARCDRGERVVVADLGDPPVDAGPAACPLRVARAAHLSRSGRLTLDVTCPVGCAADLEVTARGRQAGARSVVLAPGRHKVAVRLGARARRALRRAGRLPGRVEWPEAGVNRPITLLAR